MNRRIIVSHFGGPEVLHLIEDIKPYSIQTLMRLKPQWFRQDLATLLQLLAEKKIRPVIAKRFPLAEAAAAHRFLASGAVGGRQNRLDLH